MRTIPRRTLLATPLALMLASACGNGNGGGTTTGKKEVEIFSWWTGGGEGAGLEKLIKEFEATEKPLKIKNSAVAGGSGTNAQDVLAGRLRANRPPDSFQGHAGAELFDYIKSGKLEPLDDFYTEHKLDKVFPDQLVDQITYEGSVYSVPVNIHRSNVLWFSPSVLDEAGLSEPPTTVEDFLQQLETVKSKTSQIPVSLGAQWTADHLLESVLLGTLGTDGYNQLWESGGDWGSPDVKAALENFQQILTYAQLEAASTDWQVAAANVANGKAAFNVMGDWAFGYFVTTGSDGLGKKAKQDFDWVASPGTDGTYMWLSDSFTLPVGAPNPEGARKWLALCSSQKGQDLFNPVKGSIPARQDADPALYEDYLAWALEEWKADDLAGSFWHGVTANNRWHTDIDSAVGLFLQSKEVDALQDALVTAAENSGQFEN